MFLPILFDWWPELSSSWGTLRVGVNLTNFQTSPKAKTKDTLTTCSLIKKKSSVTPKELKPFMHSTWSFRNVSEKNCRPSPTSWTSTAASSSTPSTSPATATNQSESVSTLVLVFLTIRAIPTPWQSSKAAKSSLEPFRKLKLRRMFAYLTPMSWKILKKGGKTLPNSIISIAIVQGAKTKRVIVSSRAWCAKAAKSEPYQQ